MKNFGKFLSFFAALLLALNSSPISLAGRGQHLRNTVLTAKSPDTSNLKLFQDALDHIKKCGALCRFFEAPVESKIKNLDKFERSHLGVNLLRLTSDKAFMRLLYPDNPLCSEAAYLVNRSNRTPPAIMNGNYRVYSDRTDNKYFNVVGGCRVTTDVPASARRRIFVFGPCIVSGPFVTDAYTLPSYLQRLLNTEFASEFEVINCGIGGTPDPVNGFARILATAFKPGDIVLGVNTSCEALDQVLAANEVPTITTSSLFDRPHAFGYWMIGEGLHMNHIGNRVMSEFIYATIKPMLEASSVPQSSPCPALDAKFSSSETKVESFKTQNPEFQTYLTSLHAKRLPNANRLKIGSIVMNCNPFTLGHRHLIEEALKQVDHLYVFVVEENKSVFPFSDRIKLVQLGVQDLNRVTVLPSGCGIISALTFPEYFAKDSAPDVTISAALDLELFGSCIAPILNIKHRFAGEEPLDYVTRQYNSAMARELPLFGVNFSIIPRKTTADGAVISASTVCDMLKKKDCSNLPSYVPTSTLSYLFGQKYIPAESSRACVAAPPVSLNFEEERMLLRKTMKGARKYLEFGSGGSTFEALTHTDGEVFSVEGSKPWYDYMHTYPQISGAGPRLSLIYVNIGPTDDSFPTDSTQKALWPNYSKEVFGKCSPDFDLILIDGRFRVACALMCIKHCPNATIMIHDFPNRPGYHVLLRFLEITEQARDLCVFKVKNPVNVTNICRLYERFKYEKL